MSRNLKVLHVLHTSAPHVCGYTLRSGQILALQQRMGLQVAVATSMQQPGENRDEILAGVEYFRTEQSGVGPPPMREIQLMSALHSTVQRAADKFGPDLIHAHSPILVGMPALRVARELGVPFVYEVRDLWENASVDRGRFKMNSIAYRTTRYLETRLIRKADGVVTIGETLRNELQPRTHRDAQ